MKNKKHRMPFLYWLGKSLAKVYFTVFHRLEILYPENLPESGGCMIAANHVSHLDPPVLGTATPRVLSFVAKQELWESGFLKWYFNQIGIIPIKRGGGGAEMLNVAAKAVNDGRAVVFFPEGTRSKTGYPGKVRTGVIVLAAMTGAPIVPVRISGTYDCMPPKTKFIRPGKIQIAFGEPISWAEGELDSGNRDQMVSEAAKLMDAILSLPGWHPKKAKMPDRSSNDKTNEIGTVKE
ncbi:MAG TPA: 1-acyl-sn-glycerol-3-phosphate acyltransferase [Firmicutes bacterium]|nr:1-acyl-sn-glycerol-3-phosphate acyltransferase [Bacillota bacterium]